MQIINTYKCPHCSFKFKAGIRNGEMHREMNCGNCGTQIHVAASKIQKEGFVLIDKKKVHYLHKALLN